MTLPLPVETQVSRSTPQKSFYKGIVVIESPTKAPDASVGEPINLKQNQKSSRGWLLLFMSLSVVLIALTLYAAQMYQNLQRQIQATRDQLQQQQRAQQFAPVPPREAWALPFTPENFKKQWWHFDRLNCTWLPEAVSETFLGPHSLELRGQIQGWYGGGLGTYLGMDARGYTHLSLNVFGYGPGSGILKIELVDDDNKNYRADVNAQKPGTGDQDDVLTYALPVTWQGWKHINIPLLAFSDANPGAGDDLWNPSQWLGSGGLLQMQWIALGSQATQPFHMQINKPRFIQIKENASKK